MKSSDNPFPSVLLNETGAPSSPAASKRRLYVDSNHVLRWKDSAGLDSPLVALNKWDGTTAPTVNEDSGDGYAIGSRWIDTTNDKEYVCTDSTVGAALWKETTSTGGGGGTSDLKTYFNKPTSGITRAGTTIAAFSTAWQITGVVVGSGQNVKLHANISASRPATNDSLFAFFRGSTQVSGKIWTGGAAIVTAWPLTWIDENPGAGTYTYEIRAAQFTSGTLTIWNTNVSTDTAGGNSIFLAEVYTP